MGTQEELRELMSSPRPRELKPLMLGNSRGDFLIEPPSGYSLTEFFLNIYGVSIHLSLVFEACCTIPGTRTCGNPPALDPNIFSHVVVVLPRKRDFTLKMLCMHHIIPNRYNYLS